MSSMEVDVEQDDVVADFGRRKSLLLDVENLDVAISVKGSSSSSGVGRPQMWLPSGPSKHEVFKWPRQLLHQVLGNSVGGVALHTLSNRAISGVLVNTQYSGMGCPEMALQMIQGALEDVVGLSMPVEIWSASDILPH